MDISNFVVLFYKDATTPHSYGTVYWANMAAPPYAVRLEGHAYARFCWRIEQAAMSFAGPVSKEQTWHALPKG